ncbi:ATP-dependent DNA helicase [Metabacillus iocasae]|uniref:ATP-dependent DNA helicase DinG n=1 Tax=Priestia iocasae TaxID=2291674 RepID=A0ABS2QWA1_9BACI|nr:ATP-dependent DNA helicase [Metabacillus iocasae]MBM7703267.1 ATP-dependent DNA helicase DinG [Metabacillus iocasae]
MIRERLPFTIERDENFYDKLNEWIGDVFYDHLPEAGLEERDEQIFMAFQVERAFKEKKVMFAEAGVGTGKTIVYLLYALCYARYTGKPAIIACADETLIEQLVKEEGDIAKLSRILNLNIDVRLAKSQDNYLCLQKLDGITMRTDNENIESIYDTLPPFVHDRTGMQSFYHYGDRKEYPHLTDEEWRFVNWDSFQDCSSCDQRHRCGLTLSRDHYRKASDLIICSHDFYMEHIWTYEARKREGQMPFLPESSCVVFDEGHLLEFAAQKALTYRIQEDTLENLLTRLLENDVREGFAYQIERAIKTYAEFFDEVSFASTDVVGSNRKEVARTEGLQSKVKEMLALLDHIGNELVFESETYTVDEYTLRIVDEYLDQIDYSLRLFMDNDNAIYWAEEHEAQLTLVIMPQAVKDVLKERVFSKNIPYIFTSATLSDNKSFDYLAYSLGVSNPLSFSVESPFDYDEQMNVTIKRVKSGESAFADKFGFALQQLEKTNGRALLLFNSKEELTQFKKASVELKQYTFLFEGDQEISKIVSRFQREEETILCAVHLWEGLDVPGPSLSNVIVWSLPFPPNDPVFEAKRNQVADPFWDADMPYMMLRLKQGIGRLIRSHGDKGFITIFTEDTLQKEVTDIIERNLPTTPTFA